MAVKNLTGQKFGRLTVLERAENNKHGKAMWKCICLCGNEKTVLGGSLTSGNTTSCGCFHRELISEASPNEYIIDGDITKIILHRKDGTKIHALIDTEDIEKVNMYRWYAHYNGNAADNFYVISKGVERGTFVRIHRLLVDCPNGFVVDHINHMTLDNRKSNLKVVTQSENQQNRLGAQQDSNSGVRGVSWNKNLRKWHAYLTINGERIHVGYFQDIEDAEREVKKAREKHFTNTNPIHK